MTHPVPLASLILVFAQLSLLAFGGANAVVPEIHRQTVELHGWMTERQFADMFAISQTLPGPNVMIVTLVGYHVAGVLGAVVTTLGMCGPTAILAAIFARFWDRFKDAPWRAIIQAGLVPISVGLVASTAIVLTKVAATSWVAGIIIAGTAAITYYTRWNPLWLIGIAALAGFAGLV